MVDLDLIHIVYWIHFVLLSVLKKFLAVLIVVIAYLDNVGYFFLAPAGKAFVVIACVQYTPSNLQDDFLCCLHPWLGHLWLFLDTLEYCEVLLILRILEYFGRSFVCDKILETLYIVEFLCLFNRLQILDSCSLIG